MRLQELFETTEEDRALISLSSAIYNKLLPYAESGDKLENLGKVGDLFDTSIPALNDVSIELAGGEEFAARIADPNNPNNGFGTTTLTFAIWDEDESTLVFNKDLLTANRMKTTVTHELRHALDTKKSNRYPGNAKRYFTPRKKEHRKSDPYSNTKYTAQPAEINARFVELLDILSKRIPQWYNKLPEQDIKKQLTTDFNNLLVKFDIANLFPEKTQSSDYKRLVKRAYDFMQKEMAHIESELQKSGTPKSATGSW